MIEKEKEQSITSTSYQGSYIPLNQKTTSLTKERKKSRRPDQVLYTPRAKRQSETSECKTSSSENLIKSNKFANELSKSENVSEIEKADIAREQPMNLPLDSLLHASSSYKDKSVENDIFSQIEESACNVSPKTDSKNVGEHAPSDLVPVEGCSTTFQTSSERLNIDCEVQDHTYSEPSNTSSNNRDLALTAVHSPIQSVTLTRQADESINAKINNSSVLNSFNEFESTTSATETNHKSPDDIVVKEAISTASKFVKLKRESSIKEDSWDMRYDDNGDCLDASILEELTEKVGDVTIAMPEIDYYAMETKEPELTDDVFGHILEIYNFPVEYKTQDLMSALHPFKDRGFSVKWVDDTHALVIFGSRTVAEEAVNLNHPIIKIRPMAQATIASKRKAKHCREFLQPYKERPQTTTLMVNRLLSGALGMQLPLSKQKRDLEGKKIKDAIERKRLANKQREDAWEGVLENSEN